MFYFIFFPQLDLGDDSWRFIPGSAVSHFSPSRGQQQLPALEPSLHLSFTACPQQSCSVRAWQGATQPQSRRGGSHPVRSAFPDDSTRHPSSLPRTVFCLLTFHFQAGLVSLSHSPPTPPGAPVCSPGLLLVARLGRPAPRIGRSCCNGEFGI